MKIILSGAVAAILLTGNLQAQAQAPPLEAPTEGQLNSFPDGITPSDVFSQADLLDRSVDRIMAAWDAGGARAKATNGPWEESQLPHKVDLDLRPMHVYQIMLLCNSRLQRLADHPSLGTRPGPTLASQPRKYHPRDVLLLVDLMLDVVRRMGRQLGVNDLPTESSEFTNKTPTDVFHVGVRVFTKVSAMLGDTEVTSNAALSEMRRVTADVRSILRQIDPACRYRIDRRENELPRRPSDVFQKCLELRKLVNRHALALRRKPTPLPVVEQDLQIRLRDVFLQTQIIIAELNLLKLDTGTVSSTPLAVPTRTSATPEDVYQEALMVEHLLKQVKSDDSKQR